MTTGDNKCKACGQWAGRGHSCPIVPQRQPASPPPTGSTFPTEADQQLQETADRVERARAALADQTTDLVTRERQAYEMSRDDAIAMLEEAARVSPETFRDTLRSLRINKNLQIGSVSGDTDLDLSRINLQGANLSRLILHDLLLEHANLNGANLQGSSLDGSSLRFSTAQDANFQNASLRHVDLRRTDLSYSDLRGANCDNAIFVDRHSLPQAEYLAGANVHGTHLGSARIHPTNLAEANGTPNWGPTVEHDLREYRSLSFADIEE